MQHMVQESNPRAHRDLLRSRELRRMLCAWLWDDACFGGFGLRGVRGRCEVGGGLVGGEDASVEGEGDLDFGFVGRARYRRCSLGEDHLLFFFFFFFLFCLLPSFFFFAAIEGCGLCTLYNAELIAFYSLSRLGSERRTVDPLRHRSSFEIVTAAPLCSEQLLCT